MPKLTLTQDEIVEAIKKSVGDMGFQTQGKLIQVTLTAGRKDNGHSAEVVITDAPEKVYPVAEASVGCKERSAPEIAETVVAEKVEVAQTATETEAVNVPTEPVVDDLFEEV